MLWLGYDTPIDSDTEITPSNGTAFVTSDDGLKDGRPGTQTMIRWGDDNTSVIELEFSRAFVPGIAAIINITGLNPATEITVAWRRDGNPSESYEPRMIQPLQWPNGDIHAVLTWPPGLDPVVGAIIAINDSTMTPNESMFTIGELFMAPAIRTNATLDGFEDRIVSRSATNFSPTGQPTLRLAKNHREINVSLKPEDLQTAYADTQIATNRIADRPLVFVAVTDDLPGNTAAQSIQRLSMYGAADIGGRGFVQGSKLVNTRLSVREIR
jgi:hypothetical protein